MNLDRSTAIYRSLVLLLYGLGAGVNVLGLVRFESSMEDVFQWLPDESADREVYDRFVDQFGVDDFVAVSWPGCTIANPVLDVVADRLRNDDTDGLIAQVSTGRDLLRELAGKLQTSPAKVYNRFRGVYFGPDRRTTCLLVGLSRLGMRQRGESIALIQRLVSDSTGVPADELVLAGYAGHDANDIDRRLGPDRVLSQPADGHDAIFGFVNLTDDYRAVMRSSAVAMPTLGVEPDRPRRPGS